MKRLLPILLVAGVAHAEVAPPPVSSAPSAGQGQGTITRRELNRILDASPGLFLQQVVPEPRFRSGRFYGWRLQAFFPGDSRFAGVDLHAGDVVRSVNGSTVERPEQLMQLWDALRKARELTVEVERNGAPRRLRWTITD